MDRRLLFPAVVATAWAQQTSPSTAEAEKALRARAAQFFQFEQDKSYRKAEGLVAIESKDYYYDHDKPEIKNFRIDRVEFSADGKEAKVTATLTKVLRAPGIGAQEFPIPYTSDWKVENGEWVWIFIPSDYIDTPFGKWHVSGTDGGTISLPPGMPKNVANLDALVSVDRTEVELVAGSQKKETVTISNNLPGMITVDFGPDIPQGLVVGIDKKQLGRGEKAIVSFSARENSKPSGTVRLTAAPIMDFLIQIRTK
jgi:hypothetical protein